MGVLELRRGERRQLDEPAAQGGEQGVGIGVVGHAGYR